METIHKSDCGLHNEPAFKQTNCDCGAIPQSDEVLKLKKENNDLKEKLKFVVDNLEYRIDDNAGEHDANLYSILQDIKTIYL